MAIESSLPTASGVAARDVDELAAQLTGSLITPEQRRLEAARRIWNGMILRRPAAIARCADADDVATAIRFARAHALPMAIRGGGHNVAGTAVCERRGIVVDLSPMRAVRLDSSRRTVHVEGGATWRDVDEVTQPLGLATPGGVVSTTGVAGLALSGGVSNQRRLHGMTIDNIVSAEVVTADGRHIRAAGDENADLLWAFHGGGGNFGVVTSFEFALHDLGPEVYALDVAYPIQDARRVLTRWRDAIADTPDALTTDAMLWSLPVIPEVPAHLRKQPYVGITGMYVGDPADGERVDTTAARALDAAARRERHDGLPRPTEIDGRVLPRRTALLLESAVPRRLRGRGDRRPRLPRGAPAIAAHSDRHPPPRRRDRAGRSRGHRARRPQRAVHAQHRLDVAHATQRHAQHQLDARLLDRPAPILQRQDVLQLPRAARRGTRSGKAHLRTTTTA